MKNLLNIDLHGRYQEYFMFATLLGRSLTDHVDNHAEVSYGQPLPVIV